MTAESEGTILYLGLELPEHLKTKDIVHFPIIQIIPEDLTSECIQEAFKGFSEYTHLIFTSKNAVRLFFKCLELFNMQSPMQKKQIISVGHATTHLLEKEGVVVSYTALEETAEGVIQILKTLPLEKAFIFWPHARRARSVISDYLAVREVKFRDCILYDTKTQTSGQPPDLTSIKEIIFTSPSTIDAFIETYGDLPSEKKITTIGPITRAHYSFLSSKRNSVPSGDI